MQNGIVRGIEVIPKLDSLMTKALELDNSLPEVARAQPNYGLVKAQDFGLWAASHRQLFYSTRDSKRKQILNEPE